MDLAPTRSQAPTQERTPVHRVWPLRCAFRVPATYALRASLDWEPGLTPFGSDARSFPGSDPGTHSRSSLWPAAVRISGSGHLCPAGKFGLGTGANALRLRRTLVPRLRPRNALPFIAVAAVRCAFPVPATYALRASLDWEPGLTPFGSDARSFPGYARVRIDTIGSAVRLAFVFLMNGWDQY